jgi:hypothetical protein
MASMNINIPADQMKDRVCKCGGRLFISVFNLKEIPSIYSPSGKPESMMLQVGFVCAACGTQMSLRPEEPKEEEKPKIVLAGG